MVKKTIIIPLVAAVAAVGVGCGIWQAYKSKSLAGISSPDTGKGPDFSGSAVRSVGDGAQKGMRENSNNGFVAGKIIEKDDNSITIELKNGGSAIVFYSGSTKVSKTVDAAVSDLTVGQTITARGIKNSEDVISVSSVQVRPAAEQTAGNAPVPADKQTKPAGRTGANPSAGKNNSGFVMGEITAVNGNDITVKSPTGNEQNIILAEGVKISKLSDAQPSDLAQGVDVMATGTKKTNGSITAQLIQIGSADAMPNPGAKINDGQPGTNPSVAPVKN